MISRPWYAILQDYEFMGNKESQNILCCIMISSIYLWFLQRPFILHDPSNTLYLNQKRLFKEWNCTAAAGPEITSWLPSFQEQETKQKIPRETLCNMEGTTGVGHWSYKNPLLQESTAINTALCQEKVSWWVMFKDHRDAFNLAKNGTHHY